MFYIFELFSLSTKWFNIQRMQLNASHHHLYMMTSHETMANVGVLIKQQKLCNSREVSGILEKKKRYIIVPV